MSTSKIDIKDMPELPNFGYYSKDNIDNSDITQPQDVYKSNARSYSNQSLVNNLNNSCVLDTGNWATQPGIYIPTDPGVQQYLPNGVEEKPLDIPFYLAKAGVLVKNDKDGNFPVLSKKIENKCSDDTGKKQIVNQIQYLTCQLQQERNRNYSNKDFENLIGNESIKTIFEKYSNIKLLLVIILCISVFLFLNGFFGSLDFCSNIFMLIQEKSGNSWQYWIGILVGLFLPFFVLLIAYSIIVCKNLNDLEKMEITSDPYGIKNQIKSELKAFDIVTLMLFLFLFYALVAVLFTIKRETFGDIPFIAIICGVLLIISVLMYILYAYIPFFNTTDTNNIATENKELRLFIDQQKELSNITSNQYKDADVRKTFCITFIFIFIMAILYFKYIGKSEPNGGGAGGFKSGVFGACAILVIPALWVFNFFIAINLFYIFPVIIIMFRFIRYIIMSIIYIKSSKSESMKDSFSDDLIEQLDDFKNYSPPWGLIGVDELKIVLNSMGYENVFSKMIFPDEEHGTNISANKFFASGLLHPVIQKMVGEENNMRGIIFAGINLFLTIIIVIIIVFGIVKIKDL